MAISNATSSSLDNALFGAGHASATAEQLAQMEAALAAYPCVERVRVLPSSAADGSIQLSAYLTTENNCSISLQPLAAYLERRVSAPLLPAFYLHRDSLPLKANGEIDTELLLTGLGVTPAAPSAPREPANVIEERVLETVRDTIGVGTITLDDNFFDVGGHSLLGTQFVMRARKIFGVKVTLRDVFEAETVAELAARIEMLIMDDIDALAEQESAHPTEHAA